MMQGHNRPPFAPTIPGTNLRSHDVPTAEATAITANQAIAERDTLTRTLGDTQHQLELERVKADTAQAQLVEVSSTLDNVSTVVA